MGYITYGLWGALFATLAVSTSSFVFSSVLINYENKLFENKFIAKFLNLTKVAALGMIISVAIRLLFEALVLSELHMCSLLGVVIAIVFRFKYKLNTILVLFLTSGIAALVYLVMY